MTPEIGNAVRPTCLLCGASPRWWKAIHYLQTFTIGLIRLKNSLLFPTPSSSVSPSWNATRAPLVSKLPSIPQRTSPRPPFYQSQITMTLNTQKSLHELKNSRKNSHEIQWLFTLWIFLSKLSKMKSTYNEFPKPNKYTPIWGWVPAKKNLLELKSNLLFKIFFSTKSP